MMIILDNCGIICKIWNIIFTHNTWWQWEGHLWRNCFNILTLTLNSSSVWCFSSSSGGRETGSGGGGISYREQPSVMMNNQVKLPLCILQFDTMWSFISTILFIVSTLVEWFTIYMSRSKDFVLNYEFFFLFS